MKIRSLQLMLGALWLLAIGIGAATVKRYENLANQTGETPVARPRDASLLRDLPRFRPVMFVTGEDLILDLLAGQEIPTQKQTLGFGCPLENRALMSAN